MTLTCNLKCNDDGKIQLCSTKVIFTMPLKDAQNAAET